VRETVILTVSVAWSAPYAIYSHTAAARAAGLSDEAIGDLLEPPARGHLSTDELAAHRFADELVRTHAVTSASYDRAVTAFGTAGVIDLTHLVIRVRLPAEARAVGEYPAIGIGRTTHLAGRVGRPDWPR